MINLEQAVLLAVVVVALGLFIRGRLRVDVSGCIFC
jgi:hypothetical protein